jgi:hypothetical protein
MLAKAESGAPEERRFGGSFFFLTSVSAQTSESLLTRIRPHVSGGISSTVAVLLTVLVLLLRFVYCVSRDKKAL